MNLSQAIPQLNLADLGVDCDKCKRRTPLTHIQIEASNFAFFTFLCTRPECIEARTVMLIKNQPASVKVDDWEV